MKKSLIVMMAIAIGVALYEQSKETQNKYILVGAIVVFMYGMMRLSAKTPSKNQNSDENEVE